jgi:hypothetical protein
MSPEEKRIRERGDASDLVGTVDCRDKDGNPIPILNDEGEEILGVAPPDFSKDGGEK